MNEIKKEIDKMCRKELLVLIRYINDKIIEDNFQSTMKGEKE